MPIKSCANCGLPFQPVPQVPNQTFCSQVACQKKRKQIWYHEMLEHDPDYRENKQRLQRNWMDKNPGYWVQYREGNPEYAERNRSRQRVQRKSKNSTAVAKIDESVLPPRFKLAFTGFPLFTEWKEEKTVLGSLNFHLPVLAVIAKMEIVKATLAKTGRDSQHNRQLIT